MHMKLRTTWKRSFEDFCAIIRDDEKADLIDGVIYMASPESWESNSLFVWFITIIHMFVDERNLGFVVGSRAAFRLDDHNGPEPDIAFVRAGGIRKPIRGSFRGAPDVAIEIVSPDSIHRDYVDKRELYRQFGVLEYWIIDPVHQRVTFLRLDSRGRYREVKPRDGIHSSEVLPGFWFRTEWFWADPLPKMRNVWKVILAGPSNGN